MRPPRHAFTLLELLTVIALIAILASFAATALAPTSDAAREFRAAQRITQRLAALRATAMRRAEPLAATLTQAASEGPARRPDPRNTPPIAIEMPGDLETVPAAGLRLVDADGVHLAAQTIVFDHTGRTATRLARLVNPDADTSELLERRLLATPRWDATPATAPAAPTAPGRADTLRRGRAWLIEFDPISGDPRLTPHGRGVPAAATPQPSQQDQQPAP
jgi:prepilin-type N-terminal cleavage/methylation domain-containing protein